MGEKSKISVESYKGVRDFYPEDMFVQNYIFGVWKSVAESFGYNEYGASLLESAELYRAKSGQEIVGEQTYTFTDRGDREVTLRPEMTPTLARMVAGKIHELSFPLRWFSVPNLFRYEKPQRGRLREHFQLNVDLFGAESSEADAEIIGVAHAVMKKFGATDGDFTIKINSRKLLDDFYKYFGLSAEQSQKTAKIIDKKNKIPAEVFEAALFEIVGKISGDMIRVLENSERFLEIIGKNGKNAEELVDLIEKLEKRQIKNVVFDPTLTRGFDYYTGMVFEVFDTAPENSRSVFGGGRYDDLLDIFGSRKIPAVGFGAGDVTARDFLETHKLLPTYSPAAKVLICAIEPRYIENANALADALRKENVNAAVNFSARKIGEQVKTADKQKIPFVLVIGENEIKSDIYTLKRMENGAETRKNIAEIAEEIKKTC
jgi:histidyl-tRNA synthetase